MMDLDYPRPRLGSVPRHPGQRVVAFIGCPGSGKSTLGLRYRPIEGWVSLTLDDFRQTLLPPHRRAYWDVREAGLDREAQRLLHAVQQQALNTALYEGFNVVLPDTHVRFSAFRRELEIVADHGITIEWKLLAVPEDELRRRNDARSIIDPSHRVPDAVLDSFIRDLWSEDAWWRQLPVDQIEIIPFIQERAA